MGNDAVLPFQLANGADNTPDATELMKNFSFVNLVPINLVNDGDFEAWDAGTSSDPTSWTSAGTGVAIAQDSDEKHGDYAAKITYGSADAYLYQDVSEVDYYKGRKVKAWCWVKCSTASIARIRINDGVGTTDSSYHTGGATYELLEVEHDMAAGATQFRLELHVTGAGNALFDAAVLVDFESVQGVLKSIKDQNPLLNYQKPSLEYYDASSVFIRDNTGELNTTRIIFRDGDVRTLTEDHTSVHVYRRLLLSATASLTSTHDSGVRSGESESANSWWFIYAVKCTDDASKFVLVATQNGPSQSGYANNNTYFGVNGWVYLGMIHNDASSNILEFTQSGPVTILGLNRMTLASGSGVSSLTWTYAAGSGANQVPSNIDHILYHTYYDLSASARIRIGDSGGAYWHIIVAYAAVGSGPNQSWWMTAKQGAQTTSSSAADAVIACAGWVDGALGGTNPSIGGF